MGRHHRDRDRDRDFDRDMMDDPRMRDPRMRDPRMRDPHMRDPRMRDPRMRDPRMVDPNTGRNPINTSNAGNMANIAGDVGNMVRNFASSINLGELLRNVDINQVLSLANTLAGTGNSGTGLLLSLLGLGSQNRDPMPPLATTPGAAPSQNGINVDAMKAQLSMLADRLSQAGNGQPNGIQGELLKAINALQQSPELMNMFNNFANANMPNMANIVNPQTKE